MKVASGVAIAILLWFIPVLVSFYPYRIVFGGGGSHACLESSPLIARPWLLESIRPSGIEPQHQPRREYYAYFYRNRPLMKECGFF